MTTKEQLEYIWLVDSNVLNEQLFTALTGHII
jgi:hypothetical protein